MHVEGSLNKPTRLILFKRWYVRYLTHGWWDIHMDKLIHLFNLNYTWRVNVIAVYGSLCLYYIAKSEIVGRATGSYMSLHLLVILFIRLHNLKQAYFGMARQCCLMHKKKNCVASIYSDPMVLVVMMGGWYF